MPALDLLESSLQPEFNLETEKDELMDRPSSNMGMRFAAYLPSPVFGLMSALLYREGRAAGSRGAWGGIPNLIKSGDLCLHREKENESTGAEPMRPNTMSQDGRAQRERRGAGMAAQQVQLGPQGRLAMSRSGGGPAGFGLLSLAFPSNIMTLVWR